MSKRKEYTPPVFIGQNLYIKPSYVVSIPEYHREGGNTRSLDFLANQANLQDNEHGGKLSRKAITGLKNSINWLCMAAQKKRVFVRGGEKEVFDKKKGKKVLKWVDEKTFHFKVNFVTLTLPDTETPITSQILQKDLLNPFLTYMRKYHGLKNYVWRLEFQANGKLHVHLTCDTFLHHRAVRDSWNRVLDKNGYLNLFFKANKHLDPNSTDVHSTRKIKNMAAYLAKYMSKQGNEFKYQPRAIQDKINACIEAGVGEKQLTGLIAKKVKALNHKPRPLGVMDWKRWYIQRINFWNSPFNPRPITGRIWGCSKELSRANKLTVHVSAPDCATDLRCLMNKEIKYKDITVQPKKTIYSMYAQDSFSEPRKIGVVYFLSAADWFTKISGPIRRAFADTRQAIQDMTTNLTFEIT